MVCQEQRINIFDSTVRKGLARKLVFESRPEGSEGVSPVDIWREECSREQKCRDPEAGIYFMFSKSKKEVSMMGVGELQEMKSEKIQITSYNFINHFKTIRFEATEGLEQRRETKTGFLKIA